MVLATCVTDPAINHRRNFSAVNADSHKISSRAPLVSVVTTQIPGESHQKFRFLSPLLLTSLVSCTGVIGSGQEPGSSIGARNVTGAPGTGGPGASFDQPASVLVPTPRVGRLSAVQWANTVRELLMLPDLGGAEMQLTKDAVVNFDNEIEALRVGEDLRADFQ